MERVRLFHCKPEEAAPVIDMLQRAAFTVDYEVPFTPRLIRSIREAPPSAIIIDLSRLPSHGREIAIALRGHSRSRSIPILFVDGAPAKIDAVRQLLPDAAYCTRERLLPALRKCIQAQPAENPVVPKQMMERYSGRTTAQKLGIAARARVAVIDAPRDYARVIGPLPEDVEFDEESWHDCAVTLWFVEQPAAYLAALPRMRRVAAVSKLWVAWPKKSARKDSLINENTIRDLALEHGLVDYKVCSLNSTWSGLCLAVRKPAPGDAPGTGQTRL